MLKKIILPVVLLIFTQQELYGTEEKKEENSTWKWEAINDWVNIDWSGKTKSYPKLWLLWTILDNVTFQYGGSKIWKHGEAYYGLSNGIGFFPSFLNLGWLKVGIVDAHINVINLFLDLIKNYIQCKTDEEDEGEDFNIVSCIFNPIGINLFFNIHIISVKIMNCIKIKLVAPILLLKRIVDEKGDQSGTQWYITYNTDKQISWWYTSLSPRIELNIAGIIDLF